MNFKNTSIEKVRDVGVDEIKQLLKTCEVTFIIDRVGGEPEYIPKDRSFDFWKSNVKVRVVEPPVAKSGFSLEDYPHEYCYMASEWKNSCDPNDSTIYIVLFESH